jgi:hypothetical protein
MRYLGETEQGEGITLEVSGGRIREVQSLVRVLCIEFGGSHQSEFESQPFLPPGSFQIEGDGHFSGTEEVEGTTYTLRGKLKGSEASGTLGLSYTKLKYDPITNTSSQFGCSAEVEWNAATSEA